MQTQPAPGNLDAKGLAQAVNAQRRQVEQLRRQAYDPENSGILADLEGQLAAAEERLAELEAAGQGQPAGADAGLLYDSVRERGGRLQEKMGRDTTGVEVSIFLRQSHIPTGIVHLFESEEKPLVTVKISNPGRQTARLGVTSWVEDYSAAAVHTLELAPNDEKEIHQLPVFHAARLKEVNEITRASLRVRVQHLAGVTEMERSFPVWLLARTTAYLGVRDPQKNEMIDLSPYLAAWVTPNAPEVMALLRSAAGLHPNRQLAGYQSDAPGVEAQVRAIYTALRQEQIQYVHSVFCFGRAGGEYIQRIRLPRETLATRSANCIDGTVLMASLLEAASLNPAIVLVPGHAFLGWEEQNGSGCWDYLETTLLGSKEFEDAHKRGRTLAQQYQAKEQAKPSGRMFRLISVATLRAEGKVLPME